MAIAFGYTLGYGPGFFNVEKPAFTFR